MLKKLFQSAAGNTSTTPAPLTLGGVPINRSQETLHFLFAGSTGTGKSSAMAELMRGLQSRGDRMIIADPDGSYLSRFLKDGDTILNPFDKRSPGWTPFSEVRKSYDFDKIARSIVPDGQGPDAAWHFYAQVLIAEVMRSLMARGEGTTVGLIDVLTTWPAEKLGTLVVGTAAAGLFDKDAAKALASTRFILASYLKPFQYVASGEFSLRGWLESGKGNLYLVWREDMTAALAPLIACWVDILCTASLSLLPDSKRRMWLLLDELPSLGKVGNLEAALTRGRKHGLICVAGLQSTAQLDRIYGKDGATVLRSCFRNFCAFATAKIDPDTAEIFSKAIGEHEVDRASHSQSHGAQGKSNSTSVQRVLERVILPTEINELADLSALLALAGAQPTRRIHFQHVHMPVVAAGIVE